MGDAARTRTDRAAMKRMQTFTWIPWPVHPGASCEPRERNSAIAAIAACMLLGITLVIAAIALAPAGDPPGDAAGTAGAGWGTGSGSGFGAGTGAGSSLAGDGPGAGESGTRRGAVGDGVDSAPRGARTGTIAAANAVSGESLAAGDTKELPKFGFTLPDANDPIDPPLQATTVGRREGNDGAGRAGAGGGGGTEFMGVRTDAKRIVFILDFSASMRDGDGREKVLKRELGRSLSGMPRDARFGIVLFGLSQASGARLVKKADGGTTWSNAMPMPPEGQWLAATEANRSEAISWVGAREPDPQSGSATWDSMRLALGMQPEAIFLLTDGEFIDADLRELREEIERGNPGRKVQINTVAFASAHDVQSLQLIAQENGGTYRRVTITP